MAGADIVNTAVATATYNGVPVTSAPSTVSVPVAQAPGQISLDKVATLNDGGDGIADAGDTIAYSFTVTNNGATALSNVSVSDPLVNFASLQGRGQALTLMAAVASGGDPMATATTGPTSQGEKAGVLKATSAIARVRPVSNVPQLPVALSVNRELVLLSGDPEALKAGDEVAIYYDLTNTGEVPLTGITVEQEGVEAFGNALEVLAPNVTDSASLIFTRNLKEEDIAAGILALAGSVHAKARGRTLTFPATDELALSSIRPLQQLATATITPANVATLAPGAATVFTATYTLTQADIDAGLVNNSAEASGTSAGGQTVTATDSATTTLTAQPAIALIKTGSVDLGSDGVASLGDTITYAFAIRNTGNVTLTAITITDANATVSGGPLANLAPGVTDSATFTATHVLTQADLDAGQVQNQASISATPPGGAAAVTELSDDDSETEDEPTVVLLAAGSGISLIKQASIALGTDNRASLGDLVTYSFTVRNSGNLTLSNIVLTDAKASISGGPLASLAPGQSDTTTFTGTYTLTQADVDAGEIENQAQVTASDAGGGTVTDLSDEASEAEDDPTVLALAPAPGIGLLKTVSAIADSNSNGATDEGDIITYAFTVTNTGNVTLSDITLSDANAALTGGPIATLLPGQSDTASFIATQTVTAADVAAGRVSNQASATASAPDGATVSDLSDTSDLTEDDPTITPTSAQPAIALIKRVTGISNTNGNALVDAGDTVHYAFDVRNTGNVPLTSVTLSDALPGIVLAGGPISLLEAGDTDTTTFTATYVLTSADIAAGRVSNQATISGIAPDTRVVLDLSDEASYTANDPTVVALANAPAIALVKTVASITDTNSNGLDDAGDVIHYAFTVSNTGNVALTAITLSDANATLAGGPLPSLAAGASDTATFTATHVITQSDVDAGGVSNQALAQAQGPGNTTVQDLSDDNSTTENQPTFRALNQVPSLAVVKTIRSITDSNGNGRTDVGDIIHYAFAVHNTGNTTLTDVTLEDLNATVSGGPIASLAPSASDSTTFSASHPVTAADAEEGSVTNQATLRGRAPGNVVVSDVSDEADLAGSDPTIVAVEATAPVLSKTAARSEIRRGERASYTITASNLSGGPYDIVDLMPPAFNLVGGSATVNGVATEPAQVGNALTFAAVMPVDGKIVVKLQLLSSTTVSTGRTLNRARLLQNDSGDLLASAEAAVTIREEHVFDCGDIIGRVFDDLNADGYANEGEPGLPGVRVASVKGMLVTTDRHGRFHVPCADIPNAAIGSNFLMKLDPRSLPQGYRLTSDNPRDVRLTRGKVTKLNFAVARDRAVQLDLRRDAFAGNGVTLQPKWQADLDRLIDILEQGRGTLSLVYRCGQYAPIADRRLAAVSALLQDKWASRGHEQALAIVVRVECGK